MSRYLSLSRGYGSSRVHLHIADEMMLQKASRVEWSAKTHTHFAGNTRSHGLATTGNKMIRSVPWYSGDSAAWVQHGGFGMVDIFFPPGIIQGREDGHYTNYFVAIDQMVKDNHYGEIIHGKAEEAHKFYDRCSDNVKAYIREVVENRYSLPFGMVQWVSRARNLVCMGELQRFADWAEVADTPAPASLFGGLDGLE